MKFDGKVTIVTGGASGIGAACARNFAARGAKIAIADLNQEDARKVESLAADLLIGLGYEPLYGWRARRPTSLEKARLILQEIYRRNVVNRLRLRRRIRRSVSEVQAQRASPARRDDA